MRFDIGGHKWLRLLLAATLLFALLPIWWVSLDALAWFWGNAASWIYGLFQPDISIVPEGKLIQVVAGAGHSALSTIPKSSALKVDTISYGMPMLAALILVTRAGWKPKIRSLIIGLAVMTVITIPAVLMWAKITSLQAEDQLGVAGDRSGFFYFAFHGYAFSQPVLAVLIWLALMSLGSFRAGVKAGVNVTQSKSQPRRNEKCTCGSGRKYKRCCGLGEKISARARS